MKTVYFLFIFFICNLQAFAQADARTESKKGINNTYDLLYSFNAITIGNAELPSDDRTNELNWQDWYKPNLSDIKMISQYMEPYIGPYLRNVSLTKNDWFEAYIKFDLQGNPIYITFRYPSKLSIPIIVIEEMETAIKTKGKIKITPLNSASQQSIYYISSGAFVNLKQLQTRLYPPVETPPTPTAPMAPSWNRDIAIQLGNFFPTATYYMHPGRSYVDFCPSMFNYTDDSNATQGNIYISGTGEAAFTLALINLTDREVILDFSKIKVRMDDGSYYFPEISYISIDDGPLLNKYQTVKMESVGGFVNVAFYFDNILDKSRYWFATILGDYKLTLYYDNKNMFEHIIDDRHYFDYLEPRSITWYDEGYIMFRYMYDRNKVGMFYNKTTDTYFY